ncbi:MAG: DUF262 domain-containing protein [Bacilli bacterium]|nr:DUF262 domain-containing protein [Bacilli bacterium]
MNKTNKNILCFSPFEIVKKIDSHEFVLPRFQRELDWKTDRIAKLFDSIYKGFYINLVVLWEPKENKPNYQFIDKYVYNMHNPEDAKGISTGKTFVLDGQQRFEALYIGLYGSYTEKTGTVKELYFYLDKPNKSDDFVFISNGEYRERNAKNIFLIKLSDLRRYDKNTIIEGLINDIKIEINKLEKLSNNIKGKGKIKLLNEIECYNSKIEIIKKSKDRIFRLYDKLNEKSIMYYMVDNSLTDDEVEELFIRMNTGGNQLSNAEIILSKLSTKWESNARNLINQLITDINNWHKEDNKYVYDYSINIDFVMKAILVLLDKQSVSFKLNNILKNKELIKEMEENFENIGFALKNAFAFVNEYGFNHNVLRSNNAIIPIAYLLYKNKIYSHKSKYFFDKSEYKNLQKTMIKWLCASILSGFWSGAGDTQLVLIRKTINDYKGKIENLDFYNQLKSNNDLASDMKIDVNDIKNTILKYSYNSSNSYTVLCILYLNNDKSSSYIRTKYDIDHIFPKSKFNEQYFEEKSIEEKNRKFYKENYNLLPNLQLLTEKENRSDKRDKDFDVWIHQFYNEKEIKNVLDNNYIDKVYKFNQFKTMYNKRKKVLADKLMEIFEIQK